MTQFGEQIDFTANDARTPSTGEQRKSRALDSHDQNKKAAIDWLRKRLIELFNDRRFEREPKAPGCFIACVSADDARRIYDASSFPKEYSANRTFFGSIFRGDGWQTTGNRIKSAHPANNHREIKTWIPR